MVDPEIEGQIEARLLARRGSQRGLARELGISRGTVGAIARGRRPADLSRRHAERIRPDHHYLTGHCPQCGRQIELPCRACRDEAAKKKRPPVGRRGSGIEREEPITIALREEDEERYLVLRHLNQAEFVRQILDAAEGRAQEDEADDELPTAEELAALELAVEGVKS